MCLFWLVFLLHFELKFIFFKISNFIILFLHFKEIGDNLHGNLIRDLQLDYDKRLKHKEAELNDFFKRERDMQVEKERKKFSEKLESIKAQLKKDYDRLLRVS